MVGAWFTMISIVIPSTIVSSQTTQLDGITRNIRDATSILIALPHHTPTAIHALLHLQDVLWSKASATLPTIHYWHTSLSIACISNRLLVLAIGVWMPLILHARHSRRRGIRDICLSYLVTRYCASLAHTLLQTRLSMLDRRHSLWTKTRTVQSRSSTSHQHQQHWWVLERDRRVSLESLC